MVSLGIWFAYRRPSSALNMCASLAGKCHLPSQKLFEFFLSRAILVRADHANDPATFRSLSQKMFLVCAQMSHARLHVNAYPDPWRKLSACLSWVNTGHFSQCCVWRGCKRESERFQGGSLHGDPSRCLLSSERTVCGPCHELRQLPLRSRCCVHHRSWACQPQRSPYQTEALCGTMGRQRPNRWQSTWLSST